MLNFIVVSAAVPDACSQANNISMLTRSSYQQFTKFKMSLLCLQKQIIDFNGINRSQLEKVAVTNIDDQAFTPVCPSAENQLRWSFSSLELSLHENMICVGVSRQ